MGTSELPSLLGKATRRQQTLARGITLQDRKCTHALRERLLRAGHDLLEKYRNLKYPLQELMNGLVVRHLQLKLATVNLISRAHIKVEGENQTTQFPRTTTGKLWYMH